MSSASYLGHCPKCGQPSAGGSFLCGCNQEPPLHKECNRLIEALAKAITMGQEQYVALEADYAALREENARLKVPVSDEEFEKFAFQKDNDTKVWTMSFGDVQALIAARAGKEE